MNAQVQSASSMDVSSLPLLRMWPFLSPGPSPSVYQFSLLYCYGWADRLRDVLMLRVSSNFTRHTVSDFLRDGFAVAVGAPVNQTLVVGLDFEWLREARANRMVFDAMLMSLEDGWVSRELREGAIGAVSDSDDS